MALSKSKLANIRFPLAKTPIRNTAVSGLTSFSLFDVVKSVGALLSPLYRFAATTQVTTSTTETTIATYTVPSGISSTDLLKLSLLLRTKNNSGSAATFTVRVKVDGTTVASGAPSLADSASSNYGIIDVDLFHNRTNTLAMGTFTVGNGTITSVVSNTAFTLNPSSVITVTVQMSASNALTQFELFGGYAKVID